MTKQQQHELWLEHRKKLKEIHNRPIVLEWGPYAIWAEGNIVKYGVYKNVEISKKNVLVSTHSIGTSS